MDARQFAGSCLAFLYNNWIGRLPSRSLRRNFLSRFLAHYGEGTAVQMGCRFLNARKVHLGRRNVLNFGCLLDGRHFEIRTGSDVSIGPEATILTLGHDPHSPYFADRGGPVTIGDHVWIAYGCIVLPGVSIGEGAVIGAGAVVTRDVQPFTIMAGSPARPVGVRRQPLVYRLEYDALLT
jgi:maltose O-acetyltransferase